MGGGTKRLAAVVSAGLLAVGLGGRSAGAVEVVDVKVRVESNVWVLNGDTVRQPNVPIVQKLATPVIALTDEAIVTPSRDAVTQLNVPSRFGGTQTVQVSETTGGNPVLLPNPTNKFDPFTGMFTNRAFNEAGTATVFGGPNGGKGGEFPINIFTRVVLDFKDVFQELFVLEIPRAGQPPIQFGVKATVPFDGIVSELSIPVEGSAFATGWTTGMVTVTRTVTTMRLGGSVVGTPTGFQVLTFMSTGTFMKNVATAVTPFVVEAFAGSGPDRIPAPIYGFLRSEIEGITFVPEPGAAFWISGAAGLAALGWMRRPRSQRRREGPVPTGPGEDGCGQRE